MTSNNVQNFSIGDTAQLTGATQKQIRNWETQGHIPKAERIKSGNRAYRRSTLRHIEMMSNIRFSLMKATLFPPPPKKPVRINKGGYQNEEPQEKPARSWGSPVF